VTREDDRPAAMTPLGIALPDPGPAAQLAQLLRALIRAPQAHRIGLLVAGVIAVICLNAAGQIRLNLWQRDFYQAIEDRHMPAFLSQLGSFTLIAGGLLVLVVSQTWLQAMVNVRLRDWLTRDLIDEWLRGKRLYLLGFMGEIGDNPDQRIQQDAQHLAELSTTLLVGLLQSTLLLFSFVSVLWLLSAQVSFNFGHGPFSIPGYMVWCALAYSAGGSLLGWRVGRPLVPLNAARYAREAELRGALVRVGEHADGIVLEHGAADERRLLDQPLEAVIGLMRQLAGGLARLTWVTSGYGWLALVVPVIVAAPGYFDGEMSFGTLMMVVGAFGQVQSSLRWFVDNLAVIADWRATLHRVAAFREALKALDQVGAATDLVSMTTEAEPQLRLDRLSLALSETCATMAETSIVIGPGERVQILCDSAAGRNALFRALAGMWPWGTGRIGLPAGDRMSFLPERPYIPPGRLYDALVYPDAPGSVGQDELVAALERVDLGRLVPMLERAERWDRSLSLGEQQRLAVARLLLRKPRWIVLNDAASALDQAHRDLLLELGDSALPGVGVIRIGREALEDGRWTCSLHVEESADGPCLLSRRPA